METLEEDVKYIEKCYYSTLDKICVLKFNTNYHKDLTLENIRRASGFLIEFFYFVKRIYLSIDKLLLNSTHFISFVDNIRIVVDH